MASDSEDMSQEEVMDFEDLEENEDDNENDVDQDQEEQEQQDQDDEDNEVQMDDEKPAKKPKKLSKSDKGEIATEEFQRLKETVELYKSSLFRLQMDELLKEVRVQYDKTIAIERAVTNLKKALEKIQQREITITQETVNEMQDVPLKHRNDPQSFSKLHFVFQKPERVDIVGSFPLKTVTKPMLNVDLAVQIPQSVFRENDRLNFVYHDKRALYLKFLAQEISKVPQFKDVSWTSFGGDITKPVLQIAPAKDPELNVRTLFVIRILPTVDKDTFKKMVKFLPDRNNNRPITNDTTTTKKTKGNNNASNEKNLPPTPHYNSWVLEDMLFQSHTEYLQTILKQAMSTEFQNACMLLKTFGHKRNMDITYDGFNGFLMTMLLAHLVNTRVVSMHMSSYQMFRMTVQFLAKLNPKKGIFMKADMIPSEKELFLKRFDFVFVDPNGVFNMAHRMSIQAFKELQRECNLALSFLNDKAIDGFDALFLQQNHFHLRYDNYFVVYNAQSLHKKAHKAAVKDVEVEKQFYDYGNWNLCYRRKLLDLVEKGLTDRVTIVRDSPLTKVEWKLNEVTPYASRSSDTFPENILIGTCLNPERARSVLDHGPAANDSSAALYKEFWGDKAETRRFRDGSILLATVWEDVPLNSRPLLVDHIITYVLQRHLHIREKDLYFISHQLDAVLRNPYKEDVETTPTIISQFDTLCKQIRSLEGLPLAITNIYPVSPVFRYSSVFPVQSARNGHFNEMYLPTMRVIIQFESNARWPNEMEAIHNMKLAFYLQLAHCIKKEHPEYYPQVTETHLELTANWFVFNFYIYHEKELYLLSKDPKTVGLSRHLHLEYVDKPLHSQMMSAVNTRFPVFGNIVRFAMRWLHSHMLGGQISQEFVELVVAYMMLQSRPYDRPASPFIGFLRLLSFFVHFDFKEVPLIVDPDSQLTEHDYNDIMATFNAVRDKFPNQYAVYIATPLDVASALWSRNKPSPAILRRIIGQAQKSYDHILKQFNNVLTHTQSEEWKTIFSPSFEDYDVLIHLNGMELPNFHYNIHFALGTKPVSDLTHYLRRSFKNFSKDSTRGLHPIKELVKDLESTYGDRALFFYDEHGGDVIGVIWKPSLFLPQPFRVGESSRASIPIIPNFVNPQNVGTKKNFAFQVLPNIQEIMEHMKHLGGHYVESLQVPTSAYRL